MPLPEKIPVKISSEAAGYVSITPVVSQHMPAQELIENILKALLESLAYLIAPKNQNAVVELIMKKLRLKDSATAEEGYHDTVRTMARKPYPAVEGMRNVQRLLKTQNPRIAEVNVDDLVDNRFIRKLDETGFFDRIYGK